MLKKEVIDSYEFRKLMKFINGEYYEYRCHRVYAK